MTNYNFIELSHTSKYVPNFESNDVIDFSTHRTADFTSQALKCAQLLLVDIIDIDISQIKSGGSSKEFGELLQNIASTENEIKIDPCDTKYMQQRLIGKFIVSGLRIIGLTLIKKDEHPITVNGSKKTIIWMVGRNGDSTQITGTNRAH